MRPWAIAAEVRKQLGLPAAVRVIGDSVYCTITPKSGRPYTLRVEPDIMQFYGPWTEESVVNYFVSEAEKLAATQVSSSASGT